LSDGRKKEIYQYIRLFHGALQFNIILLRILRSMDNVILLHIIHAMNNSLTHQLSTSVPPCLYNISQIRS